MNGGDSNPSLDEGDVRVMLSLANDALMGLRDNLKGTSIMNSLDASGGSKPAAALGMESGSINIGEREKYLQTLLGCYKPMLDLLKGDNDGSNDAHKNSSNDTGTGGAALLLVANYFEVLTHMHSAIDNERKVFAKYSTNGIMAHYLEALAAMDMDLLSASPTSLEGASSSSSLLAVRKSLVTSFRAGMFGGDSLEEFFRVSGQLVTSGKALPIGDTSGGGGREANLYKKFFVDMTRYCCDGTTADSNSNRNGDSGCGEHARRVRAFGALFNDLLNAGLRKAKALADKHTTYDKKTVQSVVKLCSACLLQLQSQIQSDGSSSGEGVKVNPNTPIRGVMITPSRSRVGDFRNEVLRHVSVVSGTLSQYDSSGELLALYKSIWGESKVRLSSISIGDNDYDNDYDKDYALAVEVEGMRNILLVHHRLVLEEASPSSPGDGEGETEDKGVSELYRVCWVILTATASSSSSSSSSLGHGNSSSSSSSSSSSRALIAAQRALLLYLLDLYHRLGQLNEILRCLCRVAKNMKASKASAAPMSAHVHAVLGAEDVLRFVSVSFSELTKLQAAVIWDMLAETSKEVEADLLVGGLDATASLACLSLLCQAIVSVVVSAPSSSKRVVNSSRTTVPVESTCVLIEQVASILSSSSSSRLGLANPDAQVLATCLLRVASLLLCQVTSVELESQLAKWASCIEVVLTSMLQPAIARLTISSSSGSSSSSGVKPKQKGGSRSKRAAKSSDDDDDDDDAAAAVSADDKSVLSHLCVFSAVVFVFIGQLQGRLSDELLATRGLVEAFIGSYERDLSNVVLPALESLPSSSWSGEAGGSRSQGLLGFNPVLVQHADVLGAIFSAGLGLGFGEHEPSPLLGALLAECKGLALCAGHNSASLAQQHGMHLRDSPVLVQVLSQTCTSFLERISACLGGKSAPTAATLQWVGRALDFCTCYTELDRYQALGPRIDGPLSNALKLAVGRLYKLSQSKASAKRDTDMTLYFSILESISALLLDCIRGGAEVDSSVLVDSVVHEKGLEQILVCTRLLTSTGGDVVAVPSLATLVQLLLVKSIEVAAEAKGSDNDNEQQQSISAALSSACRQVLRAPSPEDGDAVVDVRYRFMLSVHDSICSSRMPSEAAEQVAAAALEVIQRDYTKAVAAVAAGSRSSKGGKGNVSCLDLSSAANARLCKMYAKAVLVYVSLCNKAGSVTSIGGGGGSNDSPARSLEALLRALVSAFAAFTPLSSSTGSAGGGHGVADAWLAVLGSILEVFRTRGMAISHGDDAEVIFHSAMHYLDCTPPPFLSSVPAPAPTARSQSTRLSLVRVLTELLVLAGEGRDQLCALMLERAQASRECSSDSIDTVRALFTANLMDSRHASPATIAGARSLLLDASSKIYGGALSPQAVLTALPGDSHHDGTTTTTTSSSSPSSSTTFATSSGSVLLTDTLPEEVAFFHCVLPEAEAVKKRKLDDAHNDDGGGSAAAETDTAAHDWTTRAIYTYAVLASQVHIILQQGPEAALAVCRHCLAVLHEVSINLSGSLSFNFPLLSVAIARIASCVLRIGPDQPLQKQAVAAVRRIMLTVSTTRGLQRFYGTFTAMLIEVVAASNNDNRRGIEPLVSGIFTLADRCHGLGRKSTIMPLLSPAGRALFGDLMDKYSPAFKYKG
jgi:hypothetical protein